jgi:phytoene synthase
MDEASFVPLFQVTGQMIGGMELADQAALERYLDATGALFGELLATVAGAETGQLLHARALGRFLAEASTISAIGGDVRQNRLLLPVSRLHSFGLNSGDLLGERAAGSGPLLSDAIARARKHHQENLQALSPTAALGPLLSLAALADHLLALAERDGVEKLLRQRFELTPLRKLWICWRCQKGLR